MAFLRFEGAQQHFNLANQNLVGASAMHAEIKEVAATLSF
jgi:hypothetical protein